MDETKNLPAVVETVEKDGKLVNFHYNGTSVRVLDLEEGELDKKLKPAVYRVAFNQFVGYFLEKEYKHFKIPKKVYGTAPRRAKKILNTFNNRDRSTGILLTGDKGAGKTMLAEVVCNTLINNKIPIVMVTERYTGSNFVSFIDSLGVVGLFFDEFGKIYPPSQEYNEESNDTQEALLSLMDGGGRQKRLVLLTENQESDINHYLLHRPGRVFYHFKYGKLDEETIKEYLEEHKLKGDKDGTLTEYILDASRKMKTFSFDILQAIVEEYKRYGGGTEGIEESLNDLNVDYNKDETIQLEVLRLRNKKTDEEVELAFSSKYLEKPADRHSYLQVYTKGYDALGLKEQDDNDKTNEFRIYFRGHELEYDSKEKMVYDNGEYVLVAKISESVAFAYNYSKA